MAENLSLVDSLFLYGETRQTMMHVASMSPYTPPDGDTDLPRRMVDQLRAARSVESPWNLKLAHPRVRFHPRQRWVEDDDFDIDYHVRRSALPSPGDERELGVLVSRLHSNQLDLSRPPWELHIIEGLEGGRFALYHKVHHSLIDGYTGMQLMIRGLSTDPDELDKPLFPMIAPPVRPRPGGASGAGLPRWDAAQLAHGLGGGAASAAGLAKRLATLQFRRRGEFEPLVGNMQAPRSILNSRISRNRRFATQQYSLSRLKKIATATGSTLNDVAVSITGGGLRAFLQELGELPDKPLIAFVPVNIRPKGDVGGGNAVGAVLASMATDVADPLARLAAVSRSMTAAKANLQGLSREAILAYSAYLLAPGALQVLGAITGIPSLLPLAFNVCVSNIPGPQHPLYLRGARLEAPYPVSIPTHGMALNVTLQSYADTLNFGFIGCRDTLPHLQRLAVHTGEELEELARAVGA
jgi:diacylglycerol O-acyltransferase / wax synthase